MELPARNAQTMQIVHVNILFNNIYVLNEKDLGAKLDTIERHLSFSLLFMEISS